MGKYQVELCHYPFLITAFPGEIFGLWVSNSQAVYRPCSPETMHKDNCNRNLRWENVSAERCLFLFSEPSEPSEASTIYPQPSQGCDLYACLLKKWCVSRLKSVNHVPLVVFAWFLLQVKAFSETPGTLSLLVNFFLTTGFSDVSPDVKSPL